MQYLILVLDRRNPHVPPRINRLYLSPFEPQTNSSFLETIVASFHADTVEQELQAAREAVPRLFGTDTVLREFADLMLAPDNAEDLKVWYGDTDSSRAYYAFAGKYGKLVRYKYLSQR